MPTARELLQQADALMRSNRSVGKTATDDNVPVLTDVAVPPPAPQAEVGGFREEAIPVLTSVVPDFDIHVPKDASRARFPGSMLNPSLLPLSEMPPLPPMDEGDSVVARRASDSRIDRPQSSEGITEVPSWLEADLLEPAKQGSFAAPSPPVDPEEGMTAQATERPVLVFSEPSVAAGEASAATAASDGPPPPPEPESSSQHADLAETIYYQVLQNLDLYTERALQEHLTRHLAPIIERAGQELLSTLNANLGAVIRQYVAEAIEKQLGVRPTASDLADAGS